MWEYVYMHLCVEVCVYPIVRMYALMCLILIYVLDVRSYIFTFLKIYADSKEGCKKVFILLFLGCSGKPFRVYSFGNRCRKVTKNLA